MPSATSSDFVIKDLEASDFDRGFLECLSHLTTVGDISRETFESRKFRAGRLSKLQSHPDLFKLRVVLFGDRVLGAGTLLVEPKFIHDCGSTGHIEDIVVHGDARGKGLGKLIIDDLTKLAKEAGCYKVTLECSDDNVGFYAKCGLSRKGNQMCIYF